MHVEEHDTGHGKEIYTQVDSCYALGDCCANMELPLPALAQVGLPPDRGSFGSYFMLDGMEFSVLCPLLLALSVLHTPCNPIPLLCWLGPKVSCIHYKFFQFVPNGIILSVMTNGIIFDCDCPGHLLHAHGFSCGSTPACYACSSNTLTA